MINVLSLQFPYYSVGQQHNLSAFRQLVEPGDASSVATPNCTKRGGLEGFDTEMTIARTEQFLHLAYICSS